jgi:hypothetical protein
VATPENPGFTVEFHASDARPQRLKLPLQEVTYIQGALEQSGALQRFARMKIHLYRRLPNRIGEHKLDIAFDRGKRRVEPSFDYAIRPGDRLVIIEDTSTALDDMLESVAGPLGRLLPL